MNTFARRGLQATAITAALAALGTGLAGSAVAASLSPALSATGGFDAAVTPASGPGLELVNMPGSAGKVPRFKTALPPASAVELAGMNVGDASPGSMIARSVLTGQHILDLEVTGLGPLSDGQVVDLEVNRHQGLDVNASVDRDNRLGALPPPQTAQDVVRLVTRRALSG